LFIFWKIHETLLFSNLPTLKTFKHIEAHFPQVVEAKVEPRLSNLTNATIEISPKGFTLTIKAKLKIYILIYHFLASWWPQGQKNLSTWENQFATPWSQCCKMHMIEWNSRNTLPHLIFLHFFLFFILFLSILVPSLFCFYLFLSLWKFQLLGIDNFT
jgi:hypothetical protein